MKLGYNKVLAETPPPPAPVLQNGGYQCNDAAEVKMESMCLNMLHRHCVTEFERVV